MVKTIVTEPTRLDQAASALSELSGTYAGIAKQLMNEASTMGEAWQGEDNQAFVAQITGFSEELDAMAKKLESGAQTLTQQSSNYKLRQSAIISAVKTLAN